MKNTIKVILFIAPTLLAAIGLTILVTATNVAEQQIINEAVQSGHAEYFLDAKNKKQWRWKINCGGTKP